MENVVKDTSVSFTLRTKDIIKRNMKTVILVSLLFVDGRNLKLKMNDEQVLADVILEASKKFFDPNRSIAFLPRTSVNYARKEEYADLISQTFFTYENIYKCNEGRSTLDTELHSSTVFNGTAQHLTDISQRIHLKYSLKYYDKLALKKLLMSGEWSIFIPSNESTTSFFLHRNFIGLIYNRFSVRPLVEMYSYMNPYSRTILVLIATKSCPKCAHQLMKTVKLIGRNLGDVLILRWREGTRVVDVLTFMPYEEPFGFCGNIRKIVHLDTWVQNEDGGSFLLNENLRPVKVPKTLRCCVFVNFGLYEPFYIESPKGLDGVDVRLLNHLNEVDTNSTDCPEIGRILLLNTVNEALGSHYPGRDYPYFSLSFSYYVERAGRYNRWSWFTAVFRNNLWTICIVSLGITSTVIRLLALARKNGEISSYNSTFQCILNLWSALWGTGASIPQDCKIRIILFSWIVFCLCTNTVFQTYVTSYFVVPTQKHQIDTVEEIERERFKVIADPISRYPKFDKNEMVATWKISESFLLAVNTKESALYTTEGYFKYNVKKLCREEEMPSYHKFSAHEDSNYFIGMLPFLDPLLQSRVNKVLQRLATAGIVQKIWKDIVDPKGHEIVTSSLKSEKLEYEPMSLFYLQSAFYVQIFWRVHFGIISPLSAGISVDNSEASILGPASSSEQSVLPLRMTRETHKNWVGIAVQGIVGKFEAEKCHSTPSCVLP
ncbi:hypothetical protein C0J52_26855 [Blattella germanica]|nr:hypothetical protein C0J52_26855 [Blattella germanica]